MNNKWISVKDRMPTLEDCGKMFLCCVKTYRNDYALLEWWSPLGYGEIAEHKEDEPFFLLESKWSGQQQVIEEITHWREIPELPSLKKQVTNGN